MDRYRPGDYSAQMAFAAKPRATFQQQYLALCITIFFATFSSGCYSTFLGGFLSRKGLNQELAGFVGGAGSAAMIVGNLFWGFISDRFGQRRRFVLAGSALTIVSLLLWVWGRQWYQYALLNTLTQFFLVPSTALLFVFVLDLLPAAGRSHRFGKFRFWGSAGLITATWGAGWFLRANPDRLFLFSAATLALAMLPVLFGTQEHYRPRQNRFHFTHVLRNPHLLLFYFVTFLHGAWDPGSFLFLSYSLVQYGASEGVVGMVLGMNGLMGMLSLPLAGKLSDRWGRIPMLVAMFFLSALRMLLYSLVSTPWALVPIQVLHFGSFGIAEAVGTVYVSELAEEHDRATAVASLYTAHSIGALAASVAGGAIAARYGFPVMYQGFCAVIALAGILFWMAAKGPRRELLPETTHAA